MKILIVGAGAREHALCASFAKSKKISGLYCIGQNAGISSIAKTFDISLDDILAIMQTAKDIKADFTFVGPEQPLSSGIVDYFNQNGLKIIGPTKYQAQIESSKIYAKSLMQKYNIPTPKYRAFTNINAALDFLSDLKEDKKIVIKADGLAAGKGVYICNDKDEAQNIVYKLMQEKLLKSAGEKIIIEDFIDGKELSYLVFSDGKNYSIMPQAKDYKKALDGDKGLNTGGMGAIAPAEIDEKIDKQIRHDIIDKTMKALSLEKLNYKGVVYFGIIVRDNFPMVLEFNCRLGDPEAQCILPLLKTDLTDICTAILDGKLDDIMLNWSNNCAVGVVLASGGYPLDFKIGFSINGLDKVKNALVFYAGAKKQNEDIITSGGRVLTVVGIGKNRQAAANTAYENIKFISFKNMYFRKDI
jgi:phosphoribosylamine--glycine ligase